MLCSLSGLLTITRNMIALVVLAAPTTRRHFLSLAAVLDSTWYLIVLTLAYPELHHSHIICIEQYNQCLRIGE